MHDLCKIETALPVRKGYSRTCYFRKFWWARTRIQFSWLLFSSTARRKLKRFIKRLVRFFIDIQSSQNFRTIHSLFKKNDSARWKWNMEAKKIGQRSFHGCQLRPTSRARYAIQNIKFVIFLFFQLRILDVIVRTKKFTADSLFFLSSPHADVNNDLFDRCRMNAIAGTFAFSFAKG